MNKLIHLLILSCRKAVFLIEKRQARPLSVIERMQLSMHLHLCDKCARYQQQSLLVEELLKQKVLRLADPSVMKLSDKDKSLIQKAIEDNTTIN